MLTCECLGEELLKRIRERQAKNAPKEVDDMSTGDPHLLLVPAV